MSTLTIVPNPLNMDEARTIKDVTDILSSLAEHYPVWGKTARLYLDTVADDHDITPSPCPQCSTGEEHDCLSILRLRELEGNFIVVIYPQDPGTIIGIIAVVIALASIAVSFLFKSSPKTQQQGSPNNSLANRQNTSRPNERIPDIEGTVRATPDLLNPPYKVFESNVEVEYCYMCVCRKSVTFHKTVLDANGATLSTPLWDIKDDLTPIQQEGGASAEVWSPFTSPNPFISNVQKYTPQIRVGAAINQPAYICQPSSGVVGQILRPPNTGAITGQSNIYATYSGTLVLTDMTQPDGTTVDFTQYFDAGDTLVLNFSGADDPGGTAANVDLSGTYPLLAVTSTSLTLANPATVNANWNALSAFSGQQTKADSPTIQSSDERWVGPFVMNVADMTEIWINNVAPNGIYKVSADSGNQYRIDILTKIGVQAVDANLQPVGAEVFYYSACQGSATQQSQRGQTSKSVLPAPGPCQVRQMRITTTDKTWKGTNADQLQWRDLYAVTVPTVDNYGDVTTVQTRTLATASALTPKSRKLNMLVTKNYPVRDTTTFLPTGDVAPSDNLFDIIVSAAEDPYVGNRLPSEIDYATLYSVYRYGGVLSTYFGTDLVTKFGYTFDDTNVSFEEELADMQQCSMTTIFRRGNLLTVSPELHASTGTVLFNHRNKIPGTETRTSTFGFTNDYDGIELDYIDPNAPNYADQDTVVTLYFPQDQSALNPKKVTLVGARNNVQAWFVGWRLYNKLIYQNELVEFDTTKEAALLVLNDRVVCADNTRDDVIDGYIQAVNGLTLTLSQPCALNTLNDYTIYLQNPSGTIAVIPITQPSGPGNQVVLSSAPPEALSTDRRNWRATSYLIANPDPDSLVSAMLLAEKTSKDKAQYGIKLINYDKRYYSNDKDFINGLVTQNGNTSSTGYPTQVLIPLDPGPYGDQGS